MTMHVATAGVTIRQVNLTDRDESARIDAFVRGHPQGSAFHRPAWTRAVERGCGARGHYLVAENGDAAVVAVLPLSHVKSALFGSALVSVAFGVGGGVLAHGATGVEALIEEALAIAARLKIPTVELRGGALPLSDWLIDDQSYLSFVRPLAASDDDELAAIPRKQRAEVRRALGLDLIVEIGDRDAHYAVYAESVRNLGSPVFPKSMFAAVLEEFADDADILTVRHEGRAVASVLSLYHRCTVMPYWGGGTHEARHLRANDMMYFALMRHARAKGCTRFDFGRSKTGTGAAAFKRNWGFESEPLVYAKIALDGREPRSVNPLDPRYRLQVALWKRMPLALTNRLGPMLARGLG